MMQVTVVEEGDIIGVDVGPLLSEDTKYYIKREGELVEVPWYEASYYQAQHRMSKEKEKE